MEMLLFRMLLSRVTSSINLKDLLQFEYKINN